MKKKLLKLNETSRENYFESEKTSKTGSFGLSERLKHAQERLQEIERNMSQKDKYHRRFSSCQVALRDEEIFDSLKQPITAELVQNNFKEHLNSYELREILDYSEIYYIGIDAEKIKDCFGNNFGFDDERGDYKLIKKDHIHYRYEILETLGKGAFGQVVKVFDHKNKEPLALKIIKNKTRFSEQAQSEIQILRHLLLEDKKNKYNVVHIRKSFVFRNHFCLVFEILGGSLYSAIKNSNFQGLELANIKKYSYQITKALLLLSKLNLIHGDLKPENILLHTNSNLNVKVIDFGSSCYKQTKIFNYIQSRFYRAPEILFALEYWESIDMWSLGCVLFELFVGRPLFPAENEAELFTMMIEVLGVPPVSLIRNSKRASMFFYSNMEPRMVASKNGSKRTPFSKPLTDLLKSAPFHLTDFIQKCLAWNSSERLTPKQAIEHPWLAIDLKNLPKNRSHLRTLSETRAVPRYPDKSSTQKYKETKFKF